MPQGIQTPFARPLFHMLAALTVALAALLASASAWADPPGRVGRVAEASGTVWMFDAEQGEWIAARRNRPLTSGDRLSVERDARAVMQIGSATLRLDGGSELEVTELDDERVRLHLHHGSLALRLRSSESAREFTVTTAQGRFEPQRSGHYRIDQADNGSFGGVIVGAMRFEAHDSALKIHAGQRAEFWSEGGVTHYTWSALPNDRFADWVAQQDRDDDRDARRRPYVSPEMTGADDLDRYGDWDRHPEYGALWLPRRIEPGWAPYRYGQWAYVQPWGWTWVDDAPWGFAPFHYGRWLWWRDRWAWCPGQYVARPVYAPALVAWIGGPNFSIGINLGGGPAVGWVPLSPREVYVPHYRVTNVYVTHINSPYRRWHPPIRPNQPVPTGPIMYTNQGVPGGVTVVSQNVLRERRPISSAVVAPVDARTIGQWQGKPLPPGQQGKDPRPQTVAPPAPAPRVIAAPGGAVPAAPGAARATPWGQIAAPSRAGTPGAPSEPRGSRNADRVTATPAAPPVALPQQRETQDRRPQVQDGGRIEPRRIAPPPASPPTQVAPPQGVRVAPQGRDGDRAEPRRIAPAQPPAQAAPPVQGTRAAPQVAPAVVQSPAPPAVRVAPPEPAPARVRGGPKDSDEREDRQPPGQERRRDPRQQQNQ